MCVKRVIQRRGYREAHDSKMIVSNLWTDWRDFICSSVLPFETAMQQRTFAWEILTLLEPEKLIRYRAKLILSHAFVPPLLFLPLFL